MSANESCHKSDGSDVVALRSASLGGDCVPSRLLLAPWGRVESTNGVFVVDEESAQLVIEAFAAHGTDLPVDYEHQTLGGRYASPDGQAPAAAWVKQIAAEPGTGLFAQIEWTDKAKQHVVAKEYRYLSPVALIRKSDRKLMAIHSAALTNKPAIVGMQPIVNKHAADDGVDVETPLTALRSDLDLEPDANVEEVLLAASRRLNELAQHARRRHAEQRVSEALRGGRLVEAQRRWAEELVMRDEESFDEWLRTAPVVVLHGRLPPPASGEAGLNGRRSMTAARARAEYRAHPLISRLTSEDAYVADAMRSAQVGTAD